jgi:hypothetical protein
MEMDLSDIVRNHEENEVPEPHTCWCCGRVIEPTFTAPALIEQDLCSWRCWAEMYGEEG